MINLIFKLFIVFLFMAACTKHQEHSDVKTVEIKSFAKDILIPKDFILKIEADLLAESKILNPVYVFVPVKILFTEKSNETLATSSVQYSFPKGGGALDLSTVATGQGSFYFSFPPEQFHDLPELEHLFYVSQSPVTRIDNEDFGLGCGKWVDLKKNFINLQKNNFLKINTTDGRHSHVLAGSYIFVFRKLNQIFLTQVTLTDSKNKNQLCPEVDENGAAL